MDTSLLPLLFITIYLVVETRCISVPTGKKTPITPAAPTPAPTYHPPGAMSAAPVHEYSLDNPEPAPLRPDWLPIPLNYLKVLSPNSILYIPMRIRNPFSSRREIEIGPNVYVKDVDYNFGKKYQEFKYKPQYYLPKSNLESKTPTKGGYPKKAYSASLDKQAFNPTATTSLQQTQNQQQQHQEEGKGQTQYVQNKNTYDPVQNQYVYEGYINPDQYQVPKLEQTTQYNRQNQ